MAGSGLLSVTTSKVTGLKLATGIELNLGGCLCDFLWKICPQLQTFNFSGTLSQRQIGHVLQVNGPGFDSALPLHSNNNDNVIRL